MPILVIEIMAVLITESRVLIYACIYIYIYIYIFEADQVKYNCKRIFIFPALKLVHMFSAEQMNAIGSESEVDFGGQASPEQYQVDLGVESDGISEASGNNQLQVLRYFGFTIPLEINLCSSSFHSRSNTFNTKAL